MKRVWFNKTFSSVSSAFRLIKEADTESRYEIVYSHTREHQLAAQEAHQFFIEPSGLAGKAYIEWCLRFCQKNSIDLFFPGKEAISICAASDSFAALGVRVMSAGSHDTLQLLNDKARFYQTVDLPMAPPADFRVVETIEQFDEAYRDLKQSHDVLCIKPSIGVYGIGFSVFDETRNCAQLLLDGAQYKIGLDDFRNGLKTMTKIKPLLVMEYLGGHEYSVDCIGDKGRLVCAVARKKPLAAGYSQVIDMREDIIAAVRKLAGDYKLNGIFNAQFKEGKNGLRLLEINARMSGGIGMACLAGPNLPYMSLVGLDQGFDYVEAPDIKNGLRVSETTVAVRT